MVDPLVATVVHAVTRGFVDFRGMDLSPSWWAGTQLRLRAAASDLGAELARVKLMKSIGSNSGSDAIESAYREFESYMQPWKKTKPADDLDLIVSWYILNAPDRLRSAGVDVDALRR